MKFQDEEPSSYCSTPGLISLPSTGSTSTSFTLRMFLPVRNVGGGYRGDGELLPVCNTDGEI